MENNSSTYKIDLTNFRGIQSTSFSGRDQGKDVRIDLNLNDIEKKYSHIIVKIPLGTTSFNPSFFLGLFYESIKKLGAIDKFRSKFKFEFDENEQDIIADIIEENIDEAIEYANESLIDAKKGFRI